MKNLIFVLSMLLGVVTAQENTIYIEEWVVSPSKKETSKPLIFLDFWATWCLPCLKSFPNTALLKEDFGDDVFFLYLSDESAYTVESFMKRKGYHFYTGVDGAQTTADKFGVYGIPASFLLDPTGRVIWKGHPVDMSKDVMRHYVNKYKNRKGNKKRIFVKDTQENTVEVDFEEYDYNGQTVYYRSTDYGHGRENNNQDYRFSGTIAELWADINNIPLYRIDNSDKSVYHVITKESANKNEVLSNFISKKLNKSITKISKKEECTVLQKRANTELLNSDVYDFSKDNTYFIADDMNIVLDNLTIFEMTKSLSEYTEMCFTSDDNELIKYDWNIHYKFPTLTMEQLDDEMGFKLTKKNIDVDYFIIKN